MVVRKVPPSLHALSLHSLCQAMLQKWKTTYFTNYHGYANEFVQVMNELIPPTLHDEVFELIVDSHARFIQNEKIFTLSISALIDSIIISSLHKLNLQCLRHIGMVQDEEIQFLQSVLIRQIPCLDNLIELSLQTSGVDFTLPICTDEILEKIGSNCSKLTNLDVSYNHDVSDVGLLSLIPSNNQSGCPKLVKVSLFECSVTQRGIVVLLEGLPKLKFLGYRETGQSLRLLHCKSYSKVQPLELAHLNNLGRLSRTCKDVGKLSCNSALINTISELCPKLNGLKVRVNDLEVSYLHKITSVTILELVYNLGKPSSPGNNTVNYLQQCGAQFVQLSFLCDTFSTRFLKVVCEQCHNLKHLQIRSNNFDCVEDVTVSDKNKCVLTSLEEFQFKVGYRHISEPFSIPSKVFTYVLHKSFVLTEVLLTLKNVLLSDTYIENLFSSFETSKIKRVGILSPHSLTMMTVETLIGICPELEELSNLSMWDISSDEIEGLRRQLQINNSTLVIK